LRRWRTATFGGIALGLTVAARGLAARPDPSLASGEKPIFTDVTESAGLRWGITKVASRGYNLIETMGGGGGFLDFDGDGLLDLYLVSYSTGPQANGRPLGDALYRNNGDGTFTDVTAKAGIRGGFRGMGLAVGDYDNDGRPDLYVSGYGAHRLWHNEGDGTFRDATATARLEPAPRWGTSAAFLDYDGDGRLDLFVASYIDFDPEGRFPCDLIEDHPFCSIERFRGSSPVLYHNNADGTFTDVTLKAGIDRPGAKGMGVLAADLDGDGAVDIFQANDTSPNDLWRNRKNGTFASVGLESEIAYDASGRTLGAMGVDAFDLDGDGLLDLFVTNFTNQANQLFRNGRDGVFHDVASSLGLAAVSLPMSGFGARFLDYDNDGRTDLAVANGHPFAPVAKVWPGITYAERPFLFENDGSSFHDVAGERGGALARAYVGRGLATGDYDNDGDPDLLLLCVGEPPRLLRNDGGNREHFIGVILVGAVSNRDAVGARVTLRAGGRARSQARAGGTSYLAASDPRLLFGLGDESRVEQIEVRWPSGRSERFGEFRGDRYVTLKEGEGKEIRAIS
jgi:enediyne biosynthesis protein E4